MHRLPTITLFAVTPLFAVGGCDSQVAHESEPDAGTVVTPDAAPAERRGRVANTGGIGLNLRQAPDLEASILGVMQEGVVVPILDGPSGGWYRVRFLGEEGFASEQFVVEVEPTATSAVLNLLPWKPGVSFRVTQGHNGGSHTGYNAWAWDFGLPVGTELVAAHDGRVRAIRAGRTRGCCSPDCGEDANFIIIARGDGTESLYLHLKDVFVAVGNDVKRGDVIGTSGDTGYVCGAHLHFQMQSTPTEGTTSYRPSVPDVFHDIGEPFDPVPGTTIVSKNGIIDMP